MSTAPTDLARRHPPRAPRDPTGPLLIHTGPGVLAAGPAGGPMRTEANGPAWVKAPPPRYHLEAAEQIAETPAAPVAPATSRSTVRCPKCKLTFEWTTARPTDVGCPHCGARGRLR